MAGATASMAIAPMPPLSRSDGMMSISHSGICASVGILRSRQRRAVPAAIVGGDAAAAAESAHRLLDYLEPSFVHILVNGQIVQSGGMELARQLEKEGFAPWLELTP